MTKQSYERAIKRIASTTDGLTAPARYIDLRTWLETAATTHWNTQNVSPATPLYLLAHSDDAVVWGLYDGSRLALSSDTDEPPLNPLAHDRLHIARLFSAEAELRLWRVGNQWQVRLTRDGATGEVEVIDEEYLLWGNKTQDDNKTALPFRRVVEGQQGIVHAPPLGLDYQGGDARLAVRHYLSADEAGVLRIAWSRLMAVEAPGTVKGAKQ